MPNKYQGSNGQPSKRPFYLNVRVGRKNDIEIQMDDFETKASVRTESRKRQKVLASSKAEASRELGERLNACGRVPCGSPACPTCYRQYRKWLFAELNNIVGGA